MEQVTLTLQLTLLWYQHLVPTMIAHLKITSKRWEARQGVDRITRSASLITEHRALTTIKSVWNLSLRKSPNLVIFHPAYTLDFNDLKEQGVR